MTFKLKVPRAERKGTGKHNSTGVSHARSVQQELELAHKHGGKVTPGSGNQHMKGDVRIERVMRIEAKTTIAKSFRVTREMVQKIEDAALPYGEIPAIVIEFIDEDGNPLKEVAVVPTYALEECNARNKKT